MRLIVLSSALVMIPIAFASGAPKVNLDQPGALDELKVQHPQRYIAVTALLQASEHAPCLGREIKALKARFNVTEVECGMKVFTTHPAKRHVSFTLEGVSYEATVVLKDEDVVQPISTTKDSVLHQ